MASLQGRYYCFALRPLGIIVLKERQSRLWILNWVSTPKESREKISKEKNRVFLLRYQQVIPTPVKIGRCIEKNGLVEINQPKKST